jgi:hypothetical protein
LLIAAEDAGNKRGKHGVVSYLTWAADKPAICSTKPLRCRPM